jgi:threonine dehydrogenase-like Zn-dependent dehydrogenase
MPEHMTWKEAMCYDPAQFALGGIRDANIRMGDKVAVFGLGAIGLMAVQMAKKSGAEFVAAVDPIKKRRDLALKLGADMVIDSLEEDAGLRIRMETMKKGVDAVVETSGSYQAMQAAARSACYGGKLAVVGWYKECKGGLHLGMETHFNQLNLIFSRACSEPNREYPRWDFDRICAACWNMLSNQMFDCEEMVDPVVSFDEAPGMYMSINADPSSSIKMGIDYSK